jgi:hypothetical protein
LLAKLLAWLHEMTPISLEIASELDKAERARLVGNEGRARVCARRAAGIVARDFLTRHRVQLRNASAYTALQTLAAFPGLAPGLRVAALHLVTPVNEAFTLPLKVDLITDARKLIEGLD